MMYKCVSQRFAEQYYCEYVQLPEPVSDENHFDEIMRNLIERQ